MKIFTPPLTITVTLPLKNRCILFSLFGLCIFQHFAALGGQTHSHRKRENAYILINKNEVNSVNLFSLRSVYFDYFDNTRSNNNFKETE